MSDKMSHQWLLIFQKAAQARFDNLPSGTKQAIFRELRELLIADDPYRAWSVEMLKEKRFERARKFRVGDYRVFFIIEAAEVVHFQHKYRGKLFVLDIRDRKESY